MYNDLEERTTKFGCVIIELIRGTKRDSITDSILRQLVRSGTSIGANYIEANAASSKKDFRNKIFICKKEAQETKYWLKIIQKFDFKLGGEIKNALKECQELILIFQKIIKSLK